MNGGITYNGGIADSRSIYTAATFTCDNGYTLTGGSFRQCQNDGTWSGTAPTCQCEFHYIFNGCFTFLDIVNPGPTTCPNLTVPANGVIIYSSSTAPHPQGTMAAQICLNGYVPSTTSTATRVCGAGRLWSGSNLTCTMFSNTSTITPPHVSVTEVNTTSPESKLSPY